MGMIKVALVLGLLFLVGGNVYGDWEGGNSTLKLYSDDEGIGEIPAGALRKNSLLNEWCLQNDRAKVPPSLEGLCEVDDVERCVIRNIFQQALIEVLGNDFNYTTQQVDRKSVALSRDLKDICRFKAEPTTSTPTPESTVPTTPGAEVTAESSSVTEPAETEYNLYWMLSLPLIATVAAIIFLLKLFRIRYTERAYAGP